MVDDARLDNELAAWTDRLLEGNDTQTPADLADLASVVRQLHQVIAPDARPDPAFRDRLTQRLHREWNLRHQRHSRVWPNRRVMQIAALAAGVTVVLLVIVLVLAQNSDDGEAIQGTALGSVAGAIVVLVVIAGSIGLLLAWYQRRH